MTDICSRYPELCVGSREFKGSQSFGSSRTHRVESSTPRRFGVREEEPTPRRFGVREEEPTPRRFGIREVPQIIVEKSPSPPVRRFGVRETEDSTPGYTRSRRRNEAGDPPQLLKGLSKKYNKNLAEFKKTQLKNLDLGLQESLESIEQHKYARLAQGAYDQSYKSKSKALKGLKETGKFIPELNDFEIVSEFSNNNFTAYRNRVTGERHFAVRGSDADFFKADKNIESLMKGKGIRAKRGVEDWLTNAKFAVGKHQGSERYSEGDRLLKGFSEGEGIGRGEVTLSGHSLGGGLAKWLSRKYGGKAFVYNAASNPVKGLKGVQKISEFHPDSFVKSYRTFGDVVSLGEVIKNEEPQLEVINHTSRPGFEDSVIGQHGLEEQFLPKFEEVQLVENKIRLKRTTKFRNISGITGGSAIEIGKKNLLMAIPALLLEPEYENKDEKKYRRTELGVDLAKGMLEFEGASLLKVGEGGLPLNSSGTFMDLFIGDLIHGADEQEEGSMANKWHKAMKTIREPIFGKDAEVETGVVEPPPIINSFNKMTKTLFGNSRYDADQERLQIQEQADSYGISYEEAFELTPETDTGVPLSEGRVEGAEEFEAFFNEAQPDDREESTDDPNRELESYEIRLPNGNILIDEDLWLEYQSQERGNKRWAESQAEIAQAENYQSNPAPVYSQSRRNITEV